MLFGIFKIPLLDNIEKENTPQEIREILKGFYSVIKDSDQYIQLVFITDESKFSRISLNDVILNYLSSLLTEKEVNKVKLYTLLESGNVEGMRQLF
ncbi:MAG TPA: AAA family ATPase [Leptospiraceae bacterium]|nr:AAA family ATPase [Leptospiraceae bacterium]HNF25824.1 AAA family ATPase [Leptospiraceae bacterium]HNI27843.1 AAA family ATPase [Leptospiraceae bacterium]HNM04711.1 AAA family ATPase [Leptospiraceae bacterium]HNN06874.1 AAA family ATPase [Leptospiraceae bacterium]